jgi:hypothetical protein
MQVLVAFDPAYAGPPSKAVWIIDTPKNRAWFEHQAGRVDANSAIFDDNMPPLAIIWNVLDHHPNWSEIVVRGAPLTSEIEQAVCHDGIVASRGNNEFRLTKG